MQYDVILWFIMFTLWWFCKGNIHTKLPLLILSSNLVNLLLFNLPDGFVYYYSEGLRHIVTILLVQHLFIKERYIEYYLSYFLVYIGIATLYFTGLFVVLGDRDIDIFGATLNTLEFMVFIYGILFIKSRHNCLGGG